MRSASGWKGLDCKKMSAAQLEKAENTGIPKEYKKEQKEAEENGKAYFRKRS